MFKQKLEDVFARLTTSVPTRIPISRLRPTLTPKPASYFYPLLYQDLETHQWCGWLISHILKSMKKLKSKTQQKLMKLFYSKIDNNTPTE